MLTHHGLRGLGVVAVLSGALLLFAPPALAADTAADERIAGVVPSVDTAIEVDGVLDEPFWSRALVVDLPYEVDPEENVPARVSTECLIVAGPGALYVAFRAYDPDPESIRSHLIDRDRPWRDDLVGFVVDPFNDERRGFLFVSNPAGVQVDATVNDVGNAQSRGGPSVSGMPNEDATWDAIWNAAGKITTDGYRVEMAIPYTSLRFPRAEGLQTWGFAAFRAYPRKVRRRLFTVPLDRGANCFFCQTQKIRGFENASPGKNIELVPTLTGIRNQRLDEGGQDLAPATDDQEIGLSARWGIRPNLNLNAALNPDFSQVEADVAQLDVNTRFALFFPEKRPFFLEGADFFATPLRAVFTRTVVDPDWGGKLTGKEGKNAFGVFVARDDTPQGDAGNLLIPANERSRPIVLDDELVTTVTRYRRDLGQNSTLGLLYTGREGDEYHNRVAGVDGVLRLTSQDKLTFQWLRSDTAYPDALSADLGQPSGSFDDDALYASYAHNTRNWSVTAIHQDLGEGFRADTGFVPRVDTRKSQGGGAYRLWGDADDWYTLVSFGLDVSQTHDQDGTLTDQNVELNGSVNGPFQSWLNWQVVRQKQRFDGVTYDQDTQHFFFNIRPTGDFTTSLRGDFGDAIDFANSRPARRLRLEPGITYDRGHVNLQFDHVYERLTVGGDELFTANLSQLRLVYNFNVRTFVRGIFQSLTLDRDPNLFLCTSDPDDPCDLAPQVRSLFSQLLFSYKLNPQTVVFLGYSEDRRDETDEGLDPTNRTVFLKLGYAWVR